MFYQISKKKCISTVMMTTRSQNCSRANINTTIHSHQTSTPWHSFQHFGDNLLTIELTGSFRF